MSWGTVQDFLEEVTQKEADVTASLNRFRERESRTRQFGAALGLKVGLTGGGGL